MNGNDMAYYDNPNRSPNSQRHPGQTLHRQPSRQFDGYGHLPSGLYTADDHAARFDTNQYNDRLTQTMHGNFNPYSMGGANTWNPASFNQNNALAALGATGRMKQPNTRGRSALPNAWMDQQSAGISNDMMYGGMGSSSLVPGSLRHDIGPDSVDEELIPTAIVIKNIPFAVKKEALVELMTRLGLPLPYAFNYHFDNGVFRGLAFANFTSAEETAHVIAALNHYDLHGRKLRVEYKKMLPLAERERIEREKRERRGQLEEQHRPVPASTLTQAPSMQSLTGHIPATSPSPVSARGGKPEVDMNDPQVLQFYSQLLLFKEDVSRESMSFPPSISPAQRRMIHTLSHQLGLVHISKGTGDQRQVHVFRVQGASGGPNNMSPPLPQMHNSHAIDPQRRSLNRAATTDFSDVRGADVYGLGRQGSGYLGFPESPGGLAAAANLRAAKSYADLRSVTPSPVPSTASFPATLQSNYRQFGDLSGLGQTNASNPSLAPTAMGVRDELAASSLANGFGNLTIGTNFGNSSPNRSLRGFTSWERERERDRENPGPIGGHRSFSNYDDQGRMGSQALPTRQPRGPIPERGNGFSRPRQNGHAHRGSDELSQQSGVEIVVEQ